MERTVSVSLGEDSVGVDERDRAYVAGPFPQQLSLGSPGTVPGSPRRRPALLAQFFPVRHT